MILCPGGRLLGIRQIVLVVEMGTLAAGALREGERKVAIRQQLFSTRLAASTRTHLTTSPFLTYEQTPCGLGSYGGRTGGTGSTYDDVIRTCITHGPCLSRARADVYEGASLVYCTRVLLQRGGEQDWCSSGFRVVCLSQGGRRSSLLLLLHS